MADAAQKRATYTDVLNAPEHRVAQVVDAALDLQPRPAFRHGRVASTLGVDLGGPFDRGRGGPGGWLILGEPELHLGLEPQILVPDLAGWRRTRMPHSRERPFLDLAPDWVCEVLSPSIRRIDRGRKADLYARKGVSCMWFFEVDARQIEAFELTGGRWLRLGAFTEDDARVPPFDAIPLDIPSLLEGIVDD